jgi:hypothetical protein
MRFQFGILNGSMTMKIYQDQYLLGEFSNVEEESVIFESSVTMGSQLIILLSNKFPHDTLIQSGKMVADKFIQLKEMRLGMIPIKEYILYDICECQTNDIQSKNTYWGFNGNVTISLAQDNFIKWHLYNNNKFEL